MYGKNKTLNAPSDLHAKDKFVDTLFFSAISKRFFFPRLNLYVYEYLYHIGASKAAQAFCADVSLVFVFFSSTNFI
jgi:hypothetical protein